MSLTEPTTGTAAGTVTVGEGADLNTNLHVLSVSFDPPANSGINRVPFTQSKTISLATLHDNDAEDENFTLAFSTVAAQTGLFVAATGDVEVSLAADAAPTSLTIDDDETQTYTLTLAPRQTPTEGAGFTVNLAASPVHVQGSGEMQVVLDQGSSPWASGPWTLTIDDADDVQPAVVIAPGTGGTPAADSTVELTIMQTAGDGNRVTDTVTVSAHMGVAGASREVASLSIDVADANVLQAVTAKVVDNDGVVLDPQPMSVEEGESVKIAVMPLDKDDKVTTANEALTIALASSGTADSRDFRLSAAITITSGQNRSNVVDLMVETDEDVGMETLVLDATVSGAATIGPETKAVAGVLMLDITDATDKRIQPKSETDAYPLIQDPMNAAAGDDGLNPGESFMVAMDELFTLMDGHTATYSASNDGSAVSTTERGDVVTIMAEEQGTSKVTITGTASMAASSFLPSQTVSNVASITFEVMVVDKMLTVMVAADPPAIDEGGTSMITATASRAVTAADGEVTIALDVVGDATLDMESVTIAMGDMSASAMLTAGEDDDYDDETVTVVATGSGIDGTMQVEIMVTDNDEAPAVEPTVMAKADPQSVFDDYVGSDFVKGGDAVSFEAGNLFEQFGADVDPVFAVTSSDDMIVGADINGSMLMLTPMGYGSATVEVTVTDRASGDSATASGMVMVGLADVTVMVTAADMMIDEGGSTMITAMASRMLEGDEMAMVNLTVVGDATLDADSITIAAGSDSGSVMLTSTDDMEHETGETVTVIASGTGIDGNMSIDIAVTDNDDAPVVEPTVTAKDNAAQMIHDAVATAAGGADWMVGGMVATVDMMDLFTAADGASISYAADSSMPDVVGESTSGTMLMLTPMGEGVSTITVTASDSASMDVARVDADVAVALQTLVVTVTASAEMVDEGGSVMITASANRDVTADTMLTVTVTGDTAAVSAPDMLTIAMGSDSAMAEVMAVEDDDTMDANVTVVVSGAALAAPVSLPIAVTDNDRTVNAKDAGEVDAVFVAAIAMAAGGGRLGAGRQRRPRST